MADDNRTFDQKTIWHSMLAGLDEPLEIKKTSHVFVSDNGHPQCFIRVRDDRGYGENGGEPEDGDGEYVLRCEKEEDNPDYKKAVAAVPQDRWVLVEASGNAKDLEAVIDFRDPDTREMIASSHVDPSGHKGDRGGAPAPQVGVAHAPDLPGDTVAQGVYECLKVASRQVAAMGSNGVADVVEEGQRTMLVVELAKMNLDAYLRSDGSKPLSRAHAVDSGRERAGAGPSARSGSQGGADGESDDGEGERDQQVAEVCHEVAELRARNDLELNDAQEGMLDQHLENPDLTLGQAEEMKRFLLVCLVKQEAARRRLTEGQVQGLKRRLDQEMSIEQAEKALVWLARQPPADDETEAAA